MELSTDEVKLLLSFCPKYETAPIGLDPTFYFTLSAEGDQKVIDKIQAIRSKLPTPPDKE